MAYTSRFCFGPTCCCKFSTSNKLHTIISLMMLQASHKTISLSTTNYLIWKKTFLRSLNQKLPMVLPKVCLEILCKENTTRRLIIHGLLTCRFFVASTLLISSTFWCKLHNKFNTTMLAGKQDLREKHAQRKL